MKRASLLLIFSSVIAFSYCNTGEKLFICSTEINLISAYASSLPVPLVSLLLFGLMCVVPPKPFGLFCLQLLPQSVTGHWSSRFHLLPASPPSRLQRWGSSFHHNKRSWGGKNGAPYSILSEGIPVSSQSPKRWLNLMWHSWSVPEWNVTVLERC